MTEQRPWPPEQSAKGTLRPWHYTAAGYLAVLFEDPEEAKRAQRGLRERGVPEGDLRLYDGEETLRIAARLQQERSILAKAIKEIVVDHRLQVGLQKRYSARHSYSVSYTLSRSERDTEDFDFLAQDQRNYAAERGPSATDARHRLAASSNVELPMGLRFTLLMTARSALPYNITTGADDNGDLAVTDRPLSVSRNSARGEPAWQLDGRLSRIFKIGRQRIELLADVFNTANQPNWTAFDGVITNSTFGKPTSSTDARQVQLGVRVDF